MTGLRWGAATDTGRVRSSNEDTALIAHPLFAVADGMGGHAAGEVASAVAVDTFQANAHLSLDGLVEAVRLANQAVLERAEQEPSLRGMGTTLSVVALVPGHVEVEGGGAASGPHIVVLNVGDSRVYLFHDRQMTQITEDHSLVEDLVREGRLAPEEARDHPQKNILTRVLGNEPDVEVDAWEVLPDRGDRFVLCTDGLSNEVDDETIAAVLGRLDDPGDAAQELVARAVAQGGHDNVTVVVVDVVDDAQAGARGPVSATAAGPPTLSGPAVEPRAGPGPAPPNPSRGGEERRSLRLTWRSALFVLAVVAVLGGAVGAVTWFARSTYFVAADDGEVVVFQGRPDGVLWFQPTVVERTGLTLDQVPPARRAELRAGKEQPSLDAARRYVANLEAQATTTTTSTTTTSVGPP